MASMNMPALPVADATMPDLELPARPKELVSSPRTQCLLSPDVAQDPGLEDPEVNSLHDTSKSGALRRIADGHGPPTDTSKLLQAPGGTSLLDLPPELSEEISMLVVAGRHLPFGYQDTNMGLRIGSPAICRVNKRLRFESLPHFFRNTPFKATLDGESRYGAVQLANARHWAAMVGKESLKLVQRFSMQGWSQGGSPWNCDMNFKHATLDMPKDFTDPEHPFRWWSLEIAFAAITNGKGWQPDEAGLDVMFQVFTVCTNKNCITNEDKLQLLRRRLPIIFHDELKMSLSPVLPGIYGSG